MRDRVDTKMLARLNLKYNGFCRELKVLEVAKKYIQDENL